MSDDHGQGALLIDGPVPVEVANWPGGRLKTTAQTVTIADASTVADLLDEDPTRVEALILPGTGDVVICDTPAQARAVIGGSAVSGAAYSSTASVPVPVRGTNRMYAVGGTGATYPLHIALLVTTRLEE